eukprot:TRINITY_DN29853_c0_g1_i2.p1 TRINITY_DN29853_c0_g1~~TRINITY_DN29853_c0_g1_i2.p1  ORF type:complete len:328 (+),score=70.82 TRINITY_DN29853_c0_g1_i2:1283-2266(+)
MLDGDWALLDWALRVKNTPMVEGKGPKNKPGLRDGQLHFAVCPGVAMREVEDMDRPYLYGRRDRSDSGVSHIAPWFGEDTNALGPVLGGSTLDALRPDSQAKMFIEYNHFKVFVGLDGEERHFGCHLAVTNCPVPGWIYRGWAIPPCCKETMRHLLFYIDDIFRELGIRYIITDGVLLGSYKFGGMLDWDADVDLHIHNDDFERLRDEVKPRVDADGHFVREHENGNSFLLQANDHNYLLIELNKRKEFWDPDRLWYVPVEGRLFPAMEDAHMNLSAWYGFSYFEHRLRHVPQWEEELRPMYCCTPYHYNCVDEVPSGKDCRKAGRC